MEGLLKQTYNIENKWGPYLKYGKRLFFRRKSTIYLQGNKGTGFYYVEKGLIKIVTSTVGGEDKILDVSGSGRVFGEQAIDEQHYFTSAVALEDSAVYYISAETFKELTRKYPDILALFVDSVIQKVNLLKEMISKMFTSEQRIAYCLLKLYYITGKNKIVFTQQELASYTGLTRVTVYKTLKKWKEEEAVFVENRTFFIKNPQYLANILQTKLLNAQ
ncbi:Crp/Fnr family transcriptional regulator [Bacillus sp. FJAT-45350]|uniref:Crp/Fnr family transcriptional regulator n=1 Tax=Bacillus sp. FJAT-45350 TaxID=2011014 RepID=UPI0015CCECB9|nr:Crp/Fnr family transcriptional regulator [Bacillus sp. FJAT-45350]